MLVVCIGSSLFGDNWGLQMKCHFIIISGGEMEQLRLAVQRLLAENEQKVSIPLWGIECHRIQSGTAQKSLLELEAALEGDPPPYPL